jgi:hypothetical protein
MILTRSVSKALAVKAIILVVEVRSLLIISIAF